MSELAFKYQQVIALLLIRKGGAFSNSYGLCRILSRRFHLINCSEIIDTLKKNNFVSFQKSANVEIFFLTLDGIKTLTNLNDEIKEFLITNFPNEFEIINSLW